MNNVFLSAIWNHRLLASVVDAAAVKSFLEMPCNQRMKFPIVLDEAPGTLEAIEYCCATIT